MSFDDRLRAELRRAAESQPLDADDALRAVKATHLASTGSEDEPIAVALEVEVPRRVHVRTQRIVGIAAAIAVLAAGVVVPIALRDSSHNTARRPQPIRGTKTNGIDRAALAAVASALDATTAAGSFRVSYTLTETLATAPTTTTCSSSADLNSGILSGQGPSGPPGPTGSTGATTLVCRPPGAGHNVTTTGVATVNVNPFAMVAVSNVSSFGPVTVRVDDTNYWESPGPDSGTVPTGAGSPISTFASLVQVTLGPREGAEAMMGLASPTGYLSITRDAITGATKIGADTVDGEPVTNYRVTIDPSLLAKVPGLSSEELTTINAALAVLRSEGFTGNTTDVAVDANGFVVRTKSTNNFADGGTVYSEDSFSAFGCAGAVQLPGRPVTPTTLPPTCAGGTPLTSASQGLLGPSGPTSELFGPSGPGEATTTIAPPPVASR